MKTLFLDFDGVLNSANWFRGRERRPETNGLRENYLSQIDPDAVANLNKIIEETGCKVVVSSTWRLSHPLLELTDFLKVKGLKPEFEKNFIGITPDLSKREKYVERGHEINSWIKQNPFYEDITIVILDDDNDMFDLEDRLVLCNAIEGLTEEKAIETVNKFNN